MKTLNKQESFGTITGDVHGRCFVQNDVYFNSEEKEWTPEQSTVGIENAEAALRARLEAEIRKKVEAEIRTKVEAEHKARVSGKTEKVDEAEVARARKAAGGTGGSGATPGTGGPLTFEATKDGAAADQVSQQLNTDTDSHAPIESLGLSSKVEGALRGAKIKTVEALEKTTEEQLLQLPNVGEVAVTAIKKALKGAGKKLAG